MLCTGAVNPASVGSSPNQGIPANISPQLRQLRDHSWRMTKTVFSWKPPLGNKAAKPKSQCVWHDVAKSLWYSDDPVGIILINNKSTFPCRNLALSLLLDGLWKQESNKHLYEFSQSLVLFYVIILRSKVKGEQPIYTSNMGPWKFLLLLKESPN